MSVEWERYLNLNKFDKSQLIASPSPLHSLGTSQSLEIVVPVGRIDLS